jgi:hypothetical protein
MRIYNEGAIPRMHTPIRREDMSRSSANGPVRTYTLTPEELAYYRSLKPQTDVYGRVLHRPPISTNSVMQEKRRISAQKKRKGGNGA